MTKEMMIELADLRLESYSRKVFGEKTVLFPEAFTALHNYLKSGRSMGLQLFKFLSVCDIQEEELLKPTADTSLESEDDHVLKLIERAFQIPA